MKNGNKPINAIDGYHGHSAIEGGHTGLTKREYFAGLAMQGLLAANAIYNGKTNDREALSKDATAHADALLKALEDRKS